MKVIVRKVGNSTTLTVPSQFGVSEGSSYEATISDDGVITYIPLHRNIFEGDWFNEDLSQQEWLEGDTLDNEWRD